jgi:hypothetical protein
MGMMVFRHTTVQWSFTLKYAVHFLLYAGLIYGYSCGDKTEVALPGSADLLDPSCGNQACRKERLTSSRWQACPQASLEPPHPDQRRKRVAAQAPVRIRMDTAPTVLPAP